MDTSETYIRMCEKAEEIQQEKWAKYKGRSYPWDESDIFSLDGRVIIYNGCDHSEGLIEPEVYNSGCIWLPRQDQLQGMVLDRVPSILPHYLIFELANYMHSDKMNPHIRTMEQLWLAFVMKEKYGKVWDGNDWIENINLNYRIGLCGNCKVD